MAKSCNSSSKNVSFKDIINDENIRALQHKHSRPLYRARDEAVPSHTSRQYSGRDLAELLIYQAALLHMH